MNTSGQQSQPIPLFYGLLDAGDITQDLTAGFDYVITGISLTTPSGVDQTGLALYDESGVPFFIAYVNGSGLAPDGQYLLAGEMPIGPRTALGIHVSGGPAYVWITGYALAPPSQLHE